MTTTTQPDLSPPEWRALAIALRDAAGDPFVAHPLPAPLRRLYASLTGNRPANRLANPRLEAIRLFVSDVRRHRRINHSLCKLLESLGFNSRQIEALALLSL